MGVVVMLQMVVVLRRQEEAMAARTPRPRRVCRCSGFRPDWLVDTARVARRRRPVLLNQPTYPRPSAGNVTRPIAIVSPVVPQSG